MAYFFIFQDQLAGTTEDPGNVPAGFTVVEGPDLSQDLVFYNPVTACVEPKPEQTSPSAYWSFTEWVEPEPVAPLPAPTADGELFDMVRQRLWGSILSISDPSTQFAIALLAQMTLAGYAEQKGRQDLLDEALSRIQDLLEQNGE